MKLTSKIVGFFLRFKAIRAEAIRAVSSDIRQKDLAERRERKELRRQRRKEMFGNRKHCQDCALFGTSLCNSRNSSDWCRKFTEK